MNIDWKEINNTLIPIKGYEDLYKRLHTSFEFPVMRETFNVSLPQLIDYTQLLLGGDPERRYTDWMKKLLQIFTDLNKAGVQDVLSLMDVVKTRQSLEDFCGKSGISTLDIVSAIKYLIYWFVPGEKYLSGLVSADTPTLKAIQALKGIGIRTNLDLLQRGFDKSNRKTLAKESGLPEAMIEEWVNRADFSRMPWASKATISNIMSAGYSSLAELANADPEKLYADFYRYGESIGKNLKHGNKIENSYRIAKIVPKILH